MYRIIEYSILFVVLLLLQVMLFDNLNISLYVYPLVYISFIILLPSGISGVWLLLLALLMGLGVDVFSGTPGINTIATVFVAWVRPGLLSKILGPDEAREMSIPNIARMGRGRFFRYAAIMVVMHALVFFALETLSWRYFGFVLLRTVVGSLVTLVFLYFCQKVFRLR